MVAEKTVSEECTDRASKRRTLLAQRSKVLQALEMQEDLREQLLTTQNPLHKAALVGAWDKLEDRIRILRGKPLPGALKPELKQRRAQRTLGSALSAYQSAPSAPYTMHDHATAHPSDPQPADFVPTEPPSDPAP
jgi:hypothetical protein